MKRKRRERGFTLVELVVIVGIIGVLVAMVVPRVLNTMYRAKDAKSITAVDTLRKASRSYFFDRGSSFSESWNRESQKIAEPIAVTDLEKLQKAGYIDDRTLNLLRNGDNSVVTVKAGSVVEYKNCGKIFSEGYLILFLEKDGMDISIDSDLYNTSCKLWSEI